MNFKEKFNVSSEFEDIFSFKNEEDELEHEAKILAFKFLNELEKCQVDFDKLKRKDLAKALGKSSSYISQLYSGDKLLNFPLLAKIQKSFDISFEIKAKLNSMEYNVKDISNLNIKNTYKEPDGFWVFKNTKYSKNAESGDLYNSIPKDNTAA